ncbi:hypothetical protein BGW38_006004, partial [Lunasporangiospora selenospora]
SPYNTLDLITYAYPLITSIRQILNTTNDNTGATTADFSFSVVFVFLHLLAELRVSGTMCKYITIMFGIFNEIKVFSMVLATSTIFFTIAIIHTVHGRVGTPVNMGDSRSPDNSAIPDNLLGAISTVYLMMGGRFDPLNSEMYVEGEGETESTYKNAPLVIMVMVYFTFSSILMLNVLIALINNAFIKADDSWEQVWLENKLRYVEIAENMSYHIPGFRETFNWFPKEIYYTATPYQVKQYRQRVARIDEEFIFKDDSTNQSTEQSPTMANIKELEEKLTDQNQVMLDEFSSIKEQFVQQGQHFNTVRCDISSEFQKSMEMSQFQALQQDIEKMDQRNIEANKEISDVKEELSEMKMAMTETKSDVSEIKGDVVKIQSDIHAILEALRGIQRQ